MNDNTRHSKLGLLTKDALRQLKKDIVDELNIFESKPTHRIWICQVLSISNQNGLVTWKGLSVSAVYGLALLILFLLDDTGPEFSRYFLPFQGALLWIITLLNLLLVYNEHRLSIKEIPNRIRHALEELEKTTEECKWKESNYPHLCAPFSPCVTLQWTYRDGKLVNLPWSLLVQGDVVMIKPGQESPGHCKTMENPSTVLIPRQIYQPATTSKDGFSSPRIAHPHKNRLFVMTETPYISNLQLALEKALDRPVTVHNKQRHLIFIKCMEGVVLPLCIILCIMIETYLGHVRGSHSAIPWGQVFILPTVTATLPLLSMAYPVVWTLLNIYAMSKFKHLLQSSFKHQSNRSGSISEELSKPLMLNSSLADKTSMENFVDLWKTSTNILLGKENLVSRSANIVHVLGSVSALCCVDKKGILSWPNPTAEKVFFLRNSSGLSHSSSKSSCGLDSGGQTGEGTNGVEIRGRRDEGTYPWSGKVNHGSLTTMPHLNPTTVAEVLDLTHDQNIPFKLEFDDHSWKNHLSFLKPLGLAILVNTCNMDTQEHYTNFCSHLTCEATQSEDVVPVTNRRCLCELAKQIGFVEEAKSIYTLQTPLATFRHLPPEVIRRDTRFARSLHLSTRVKVPLPHMLGAVIRDQAGGLQLMTQGTADIILDSCSEFWNGQDLCLLSPSDRKKVLDFYQRSSLTAYCSAFAYRPLTRGVSHSLSALYLELPADCRSLYPPTPGWSEPHPPLTSHYHSTDSLLFNDLKEDDVTDVEGYFDLQCNQVFIGMVTMQYQAQSDMVELIERLDKACIRFVHFSKENELRSRVFSEKMGLESGWNCHISLSSDDRAVSPTTSQNLPTPLCSEKGWKGGSGGAKPEPTTTRGDSFGEEGHSCPHSSLEASKALSNSAPGAINLEHSTVKFDNETSHMRYSARNDSIVSQSQQAVTFSQANDQAQNENNRRISQDSVLLGGWEGAGEGAEGCRSLSCLTDSTDHSAPVNFDMRNRAKLPRGIDNIRPHIEQVDNVPLLVSLFTDCTSSTARRMLEIMQDYSQVVCVMGSAANKDNMEIFMQADASIAVEPLYPVLCQKVPPYQSPERGMGPIDLARTLNSIPCSISVTREADVSLFALVTLARHLMLCLWNASQYWLSAVCSLVLLQMLSLACGVPQILSVGCILWLSLIVIPAVSVALTLAPLDSNVMANATNKLHTSINFRMCIFAMWCYGYKFLPSIVIILVSYMTMLRNFCNEIIKPHNGTAECMYIVYPRVPVQYNLSDLSNSMAPDGKMWRSWEKDHHDGYMMAQQMTFFMTTFLFLTISISFVFRDYSLWQKNVFSNRTWTITIIVLFSIQLGYWCTVSLMTDDLEFTYPLSHIIVSFTSPLIVIVLNEGIKWQEIKVNLRYQKRARLDFGTKLGMNSPF